MAEYKKVTPYGSEASKKEQVTKMFDNIAHKYDFNNRFLSLGIDTIWRNIVIKRLRPFGPKHILDVATGTADLAIEMAKKLKPDHVTGMDISSEMLRYGSDKVKKQNLDEVIKLEKGDSENLKYESDSFDAVTASFGVRNFENLEKGLAEMYRVLRPGGRLIILEFSRPRTFPIKQVFNAYFKYILPVIGKMKSKDDKAYQYLYESVQVFPDYEKFTNILDQLGFEETAFKPLTFGICTIYSAKK